MRVKALAGGGAEMKGTQLTTEAHQSAPHCEAASGRRPGICGSGNMLSVSQIRHIKKTLSLQGMSCTVLLIDGTGGVAPGVMLD